MRRSRWILGISLTISLICAAAPIAAAGSSGGVPPGGDRVLQGKTSEGERIQVSMNRIRGGWGLQELEFGIELRCQDGHRIDGGFGIFWGSPVHPVQNDRFAFDEVNSDLALHFHGRIGPRSGSGTIELTIAALTSDEKAQTCTSKEQTWTLKRTSPPLDASCCAPQPTRELPVFRMTVRVDHGTVHVTRAMSVDGSSNTASRGARYYSGSTSQGGNADFITQQFDPSRRVTDMDFDFRMRCQDATGYTLGTGWGFGGHTGPRLSGSGNFGFDSVDIFEGFHVHGRLGAHAGSGTTTENMPALTQDEQAMLCTSKERTWSAKRATPPPPPPGGEGGQPPPPSGTPRSAMTVRTTSR